MSPGRRPVLRPGRGPASARADELASTYLRVRPRLVRIAYATLGSYADAEDVVSDVWLRLTEADARDPIADVEAWAVVVVARRALDVLRSARRRRESYVGPWLPEPLVASAPDQIPVDPADRVTLDESVSFALMVVLESLSPAERTAWVLHDLFGVPFPEVAAAVGRTPAAVRQLASRARRHVAAGAANAVGTADPPAAADPRGVQRQVGVVDSAGRARRIDEAGPVEHRAVLAAFLAAAAQGDLAGLIAVLDAGVTATSDGGGQVQAARRPVTGADKVARFILGLMTRVHSGHRFAVVDVNGADGIAVFDGDRLTGIVSFTLRHNRIRRIDLVLAPDKLATAGAALGTTPDGRPA